MVSKIRRSSVLDYEAKYEESSTTALSANPAVAVPLLTINGWILMQRMDDGSTVSFKRKWAAYRDGFGSAAGNDNYWLGLDKIYRLMQLGSVRLRVEVRRQCRIISVSLIMSSVSVTTKYGSELLVFDPDRTIKQLR